MITNKPTGKNKKRSLVSKETNSNDTTKWNKGATCLICNNVLKDTQQAIFCEGACKQWIHRQCASLTVDAYTKVGESQQPFYCLHCIVLLQKQEIDLLKEQVKSVSDKLDSLLPNSTTTSNNTSQNVS